MPSKFLTISAFVLCCLFAGSSTRADSVKNQSPLPDFAAPSTSSCGWGCGFNTLSFAGSWETVREQRDFADFLKNSPLAATDHRTFDPLALPADLHHPILPVPEPGSSLLTGVGLIALALLAAGSRRKLPVPLTADC